MSYIGGLIESNLKSLTDMLKNALAAECISIEDLRLALEAESAPVPAGGDIYNVTESTNLLLAKLSNSPDRDMLIIVKKLLRSTKYAATTYYAVSGADDNPHHLPVQRLESMVQNQ